MVENLLIDGSGESWPANSWMLARRIGYRDPRTDLASFAVRERGFIHLRPFDDGVRVALRPGGFSRITLAGAMQALNELEPCRILMLVLGAERGQAELFGSVFAFVERAESLTTDAPFEVKVPRYSVERALRNLGTPDFADARPIVELWRGRRGALDNDVWKELAAHRAWLRAVVARKVPGTSHLVTHYFGLGHRHLRPCETLMALGRELHERPDRDYGAWVAQSYAEGLWDCRVRIDSVRARVHTSAAATLLARYDRVLMPWRSGSDTFVMGISIRRALAPVS
jgi:hypothetical protein